MGGSLGAKNINEAIFKNLDLIKNQYFFYFCLQVRTYTKDIEKFIRDENIKIFPYFEKSYEIMGASDLILCKSRCFYYFRNYRAICHLF